MPQSCESSGTHLYLSNGHQKIILYFSTHNPTSFQIVFTRGQVKLGPRITRSWENVAQELHVLSTRNQDHVYNPQMGIQSMISYLETKNFYFSTHQIPLQS